MCDVTAKNFAELLPGVEKSFSNASFFSIDLEFSALQPLKSEVPSLFDNSDERYAKLRKNLDLIVPIQVGVTAFQFDADRHEYFADVYTFYVFPGFFGPLDRSFICQASSLKFLCLHNFDFNKFVYSGIPFVNEEGEKLLRDNSFAGEALSHELMEFYTEQSMAIREWYVNSNDGDTLELKVLSRFVELPHIKFLVHRKLRKQFKRLHTYESEGRLYAVKAASKEKQVDVTASLIDYLIGFRKVFNILVESKKPLVGHNLLQDLLILMHNLDNPLPLSYAQFKARAHALFPVIFDTKFIFYEIKQNLSRDCQPDRHSLAGLYAFFKEGMGRQLAKMSPIISCQTSAEHYHEAGWDSYCTGYIFIRLAYLKATQNYAKDKKFMPMELYEALSEYKNRMNVIRGASAFVQMDGNDPISHRPPWLVVEPNQNKALDIEQVTALFSAYGTVDIRRLSKRSTKLLVAVDTNRTVQIITTKMKTNKELRIVNYSVLRHNPIVKRLIWSALTISGSLLLWSVWRRHRQ